MKILKAIVGLVGVFVTLPIALWLQHQVLVRVQASELMMFLFWAYVPLVVLMHCIVKLADE